MKRTLVVAALAVAASSAWSDGQASRLPANATYRDECGSCHVAFPPGLLPAASWQHLMGDLPHHFGSDASLEPAVRESLTTWLAANASKRRLDPPPQDRLTKTSWFVREHREVTDDAWRRPAIRSAANCSACHEGAAAGDYDEHRVRIPR